MSKFNKQAFLEMIEAMHEWGKAIDLKIDWYLAVIQAQRNYKQSVEYEKVLRKKFLEKERAWKN